MRSGKSAGNGESAQTSPTHRASPLHIVYRLVAVITGPWTRKNLQGWIILLGALFFIKGCVIDQYTIPSGSMEETLHGDPRYFHGDRVLTNKWLYGPRIPFTAIRLWNWAEPRRWDIVVFYAVPGSSEHSVLVKRLVGLPGERIHIQDGKVFINGTPLDPPPELRDKLHYTTQFALPEVEIKRIFLTWAKTNQLPWIFNPERYEAKKLLEDMSRWHDKVASLDVEQLSPEEIDRLCEGLSKLSLTLAQMAYDHQQPALPYGIRPEDQYSVVPKDSYFMLGDNSAQSADSRVWGWVPRNNLLGRAFAIWWPWHRRRDFTGFSRTWWGMLLLYGIPAVLVAQELRHYQKERGRKKKSKRQDF